MINIKIKILERLILLMVIQFLLLNCDETVEPQEDVFADFLSLKVGNYWVYNKYDKDINNNIDYSSLREDSIVIEKSETILNRMAYYFVIYESDTVLNTMILSYEDGVVYRLYDSTKIIIPTLKQTWFPIADFKMSMNGMWNIYKQIIGNYIFTEGDSSYFSVFRHTVNGEYIYEDSLLLDGSKSVTKIFKNKYDSKLDYRKARQLTETSWDTLSVSHLLKYYDYYQFVKGVGLYKISRDSYFYTIQTEPFSEEEMQIAFKGYEYILKRYKVK
jgi:hypothetical protein